MEFCALGVLSTTASPRVDNFYTFCAKFPLRHLLGKILLPACVQNNFFMYKIFMCVYKITFLCTNLFLFQYKIFFNCVQNYLFCVHKIFFVYKIDFLCTKSFFFVYNNGFIYVQNHRFFVQKIFFVYKIDFLSTKLNFCVPKKIKPLFSSFIKYNSQGPTIGFRL